MEKYKLLDQRRVTSEDNGEQKSVRVPEWVSALSAKTAAIYLQVHEVDDDTRITVGAVHTANPDSGQFPFDTDWFDSGTESGVDIGLFHESEDVSGVDQLLLVPSIGLRPGGSGTDKSAVISLWLILKPF